MHKTFPSNSGQTPVGAESVARQVYGMNSLTAECSAAIMMNLVTGK
jgi:hypothetical protein